MKRIIILLLLFTTSLFAQIDTSWTNEQKQYARKGYVQESISDSLSDFYRLGYTQAETDSAVKKSLMSGVINVKEFGATGTDTTNDTQAFKNALTVGASLGQLVTIPPGTYYIDDTLTINYGGGGLKGVSSRLTIIKMRGNALINVTSSSDITLKGIKFISVTNLTSGIVFNGYGGRHHLSDLQFWSTDSSGGVGGSDFIFDYPLVLAGNSCTVENIYIYKARKVGIYFKALTSVNVPNAWYARQLNINDADTAIKIDDCSQAPLIQNVIIQGLYTYGIYADGANHLIIDHPYFEAIGADGVFSNIKIIDAKGCEIRSPFTGGTRNMTSGARYIFENADNTICTNFPYTTLNSDPYLANVDAASARVYFIAGGVQAAQSTVNGTVTFL